MLDQVHEKHRDYVKKICTCEYCSATVLILLNTLRMLFDLSLYMFEKSKQENVIFF
jgi:hypothetical protein